MPHEVPVLGGGLSGDLALQIGETQRGLLHSQQLRSPDWEEEDAVTGVWAEAGSDEVLPLAGDQKEVQGGWSDQPIRGQIHELPNWVWELPQVVAEGS